MFKFLNFKNKKIKVGECKDIEGKSRFETSLLKNFNSLKETIVKEIMIPRISVVFVDYSGSKDEILRVVTSSNHSRFPVYRETIDDIIGIIHTKDILFHMCKRDFYDIDLKDIMRKVMFVPESKKIDSLLKEFQESHIHIAIVVDEYGGVSGLVTLEDILEEIVGDIQDEFDNELDEIVPLDDGSYLCTARVLIEDLNEALGLSLPDGDFDTLGGFVYDLFGRIPLKNEKIEYNNLTFTIKNMHQRNIKVIKISQKEGL
ncbi:Magnesium and cobalt efflux protein CorC [Borrelia miyamotoi]|uniref:Hemolysin family protein n=1 Tax=Borrelia miyamotoi TaxID=47466 RepID=A0AAP8YW29_9SPIR|nr:hemolysin family protein [Borrelia miyamotoi]ATQ15117.1 hemolysin family protein [Borrelia miyamotoi]ATQ16299.1 hemolysin family protein [Borrelia miyamotoi]ATQ17443.1 hemolysin family protein [Borrelia miyamotoi]ATQ18055.1 hemolysin family protein [Borrelia miyamotoi]ATQ19939.1 hemolysin family protein [Borrelia miyamotoi]